MEKLVRIDNERIVTSSRKVAEVFGKQHKNVMRDIRNLIENLDSPVLSREIFYESEYINSRGRKYKQYLMNKDGFILLAMGFTGKKATQFKLEFIQAFNAMEEEIIRLEQSQQKLYEIAASDDDVEERQRKADKEKYRLQNINTVLKNAEYTTLEQEIENIITHHENLPVADRYKPDRSLSKTEYKQKVRDVIISKLDTVRREKDSLYDTVGLTLTRKLREDMIATNNRSFGQERRYLKEVIDDIDIPHSKYICLPIHGFSVNYMYKDVGSRTILSPAYERWLASFPMFKAINGINDFMDIDLTKEMEIFIKFDCKDEFDVENLSKSFIDKLASGLNIDDNLFSKVHLEKNKTVDSYGKGKIYFYIRNI